MAAATTSLGVVRGTVETTGGGGESGAGGGGDGGGAAAGGSSDGLSAALSVVTD